MNVQKITAFLFIVFFLFIALVSDTGCANIIPPEGGARDSLPPVLLKATPVNDSRNFSAERITFSFDEYVEVENYMQNLIVSPLPENMPTVTRKLNTITVKLRDTLEPNTTYSLNFGNSIKDLNEGNVMKNFTYIFATGRYIDSLQLGGRVLLAETGETDSTLTVILHRSKEDSVLKAINQRPRYVAKTDGHGHFLFRNLPPGTFYIYALKDEGGYRYQSTKQLFAFADAPVTVGQQTDSVVLYAYVADKATGSTTTASAGGRGGNRAAADKRLKFGANLINGKQSLLDKLVFTFEVPLRHFDSSKIHFSTDSTFTPVTGYSWNLDSSRKSLSLQYDWRENISYHLILEKDFATDTLGQQLLKIDTISFSTRAKAEYAGIKLRFRNLDLSRNPVLQFVQNNEVRNSYPLTGETFSLPLFEPGEYSLRILSDANKNGKWDPGEFFGKHKQPEIVRPVGRRITIRPNFDNQFEIAL